MLGKTISHYKIIEKIGQGGMGVVYRATDTRLNQEVALKVLPEAFAADPQRMGRFSREAQILASFSHPNIAAIHGLVEADGKRALVMELVEGEMTERGQDLRLRLNRPSESHWQRLPAAPSGPLPGSAWCRWPGTPHPFHPVRSFQKCGNGRSSGRPSTP